MRLVTAASSFESFKSCDSSHKVTKSESYVSEIQDPRLNEVSKTEREYPRLKKDPARIQRLGKPTAASLGKG